MTATKTVPEIFAESERPDFDFSPEGGEVMIGIKTYVTETNRRRETALASIQKIVEITPARLFVILNDGSSEGFSNELDALAAGFQKNRKDVLVVRNKTNEGVGKAQNALLCRFMATPQRVSFCFLLDDDVFPEPGWMEDALLSPPHAHYMTPKLSKISDAPKGFCLKFTREVVERCGWFDERFGRYGLEHEHYLNRAISAGLATRKSAPFRGECELFCCGRQSNMPAFAEYQAVREASKKIVERDKATGRIFSPIGWKEANLIVTTWNNPVLLKKTLGKIYDMKKPEGWTVTLTVALQHPADQERIMDARDCFFPENLDNSKFCGSFSIADGRGYPRNVERAILNSYQDVILILNDDIDPAPDALEKALEHYTKRVQITGSSDQVVALCDGIQIRNDGSVGREVATQVLLTKNFYLKNIFPTPYGHWFQDDEWSVRAKALGIFSICAASKIGHARRDRKAEETECRMDYDKAIFARRQAQWNCLRKENLLP